MILVTGGGGFLGGAIVRQLVARGERVRSFSRQRHSFDDVPSVEQIQGDIADASAVRRAMAGCEAVIHVAAKAGVWGPRAEYEAANVVGTRNVVVACREHRIRRLVFTSTPSVVAAGHDIEGGDESLPYPAKYLADYPRTKAIAEREILAANGRELATVALRPHLIFGPGDPHLVPRLLVRARTGKMRRIGDGNKRIDVTDVNDAATAHLLALDRLAPGSRIAGRAYFLSQGDPVNIWSFINRILDFAGQPPVTRQAPYRVAYLGAWMLERMYAMLRLPSEPPMTRFLVAQLGHSHWFDISAARRDLGYEPRLTVDQLLERLKPWLQDQIPKESH